MQVHKGNARGSGRLARIGVELSREPGFGWPGWISIVIPATRPVRAITSASAAGLLALPAGYDPYDLTTLESRSHPPHRQPADLNFSFRGKGFEHALAVSALGLRINLPFSPAVSSCEFLLPWWVAFSLS
jgi:hypothetical protein